MSDKQDPRQILMDSLLLLGENSTLETFYNDILPDIYKKMCDSLGHCSCSVADLCGNPEHDYCSYCQECTPGKAKRSN